MGLLDDLLSPLFPPEEVRPDWSRFNVNFDNAPPRLWNVAEIVFGNGQHRFSINHERSFVGNRPVLETLTQFFESPCKEHLHFLLLSELLPGLMSPAITNRDCIDNHCPVGRLLLFP